MTFSLNCLLLDEDSREFTPNHADVEAILHYVMILMASEAQLSLASHIGHVNDEAVHLSTRYTCTNASLTTYLLRSCPLILQTLLGGSTDLMYFDCYRLTQILLKKNAFQEKNIAKIFETLHLHLLVTSQIP